VPEVPTVKKPPIVSIYKTLAYVTGVGLIILVFLGIPLQIWAHNTVVVAVVGTAHGFLYMAYVLVALALSLQARYNPVKAVLVAAAGTVPFCAFIAEHYIAKDAAQRITANKERYRARAAATSATPPKPPTTASVPPEPEPAADTADDASESVSR
jgi:integral membrane protein